MDTPHENQPENLSAQAITFARVRVWSMVGLGFALIALVMLAWQSTRLDTYIWIFEDFQTELPTLTKWVMKPHMLGYLMMCGITAVLLIWKEYVLRDKGLTLIINVSAAAISVIWWVLMQMAFILPMSQLMR